MLPLWIPFGGLQTLISTRITGQSSQKNRNLQYYYVVHLTWISWALCRRVSTVLCVNWMEIIQFMPKLCVPIHNNCWKMTLMWCKFNRNGAFRFDGRRLHSFSSSDLWLSNEMNHLFLFLFTLDVSKVYRMELLHNFSVTFQLYTVL